jgi:succinate dehydrogenase/fumarate reductase flavoprotein subunit
MSGKISRREFIKYGVAVGAAFGVSRFPVVEANAAEFVGNPPRSETFDVIVVGTGMAGMAAAVSAAENGAKVVLLEKQQQALAGGSSALALGGFSLPEADTPEARQLFIDEYVKKSGNRADRALTQFLAENITADIEWLTGLGANLMAATPARPYRTISRQAFPGSFRGMPSLLAAMHTAGKKSGVVEVYRAKAKALLVDSTTGRVAGVRVSTSAGLVDYRAKATVLATGGYIGNPKMLEQWIGPNADESVVRGAKWLTGDGLRMADEIGAGLVQMGGLDSVHIAGVSPKNPASGQPSAVLSHVIGINKLGRRFIDESLGYVAFGKAIIDQPGAEVALVFDQAMAEAAPGKAVIDQYTHFKLDIIKADTLEELAGRIGCPAPALVDTVAKFNAAVQDSKAPAAAPPKAALANKVERPPFYALYPLKPGLTQTFGGLRINPGCQVLEADGAPIRGLYAAGEVTGGYFSIDYVGGGSLSRCVVTGRAAGKNAAKEA